MCMVKPFFHDLYLFNGKLVGSNLFSGFFSSLTPATPSSESNLSPTPRNTTPSQPQDEHGSCDGLHPPSKYENEPLLFPDVSVITRKCTELSKMGCIIAFARSQIYFLCICVSQVPTTLLDTGALRSRVQLGKKRAPRTRPSRAARQNTTQDEDGGATSEDWLYRDSTGLSLPKTQY